MTTYQFHTPIMRQEVVSILDIRPDDIVIDGTIGFCGHAQDIYSRLIDGHYIGVDQDIDAITHCKHHLMDTANHHPPLTLIHGNYSAIFKDPHIVPFKGKVTKVLLDLGFSSYQLDQSGRGFSFMRTEPLDMRLSITTDTTAADILNTFRAEQLSDIFFHYGDLIHNKRLVTAIMQKRPLSTTTQLFQIIKQSYGFNKRRLLMKTASQVFQAIRIAVNNEFQHLQDFMSELPTLLSPGAKIAIITFHSGEDRLVKQTVQSLPYYRKINKKVIKASQDEIHLNARAKPAKLRGILYTNHPI